LLFGNDPSRSDGRKLRGQRVFCSNRGQRGGCGHTFSVFLDDMLPRHTLTATVLWSLLAWLLTGASVRSGARQLKVPLALISVYHLLGRLRRRLDAIRVCLCARQRPPKSLQRDPFLQTLEHLKAAFAEADCPVRQFQLVLQQPLLG
jgi:hypothetical protein